MKCEITRFSETDKQILQLQLQRAELGARNVVVFHQSTSRGIKVSASDVASIFFGSALWLTEKSNNVSNFSVFFVFSCFHEWKKTYRKQNMHVMLIHHTSNCQCLPVLPEEKRKNLLKTMEFCVCLHSEFKSQLKEHKNNVANSFVFQLRGYVYVRYTM